LAIAGALALKGYSVNVFNKTAERIRFAKLTGGVEVSGVMEGFGKLDVVTTRIKDAIEGAEVLMVVVPATGHRYIAEVCAQHLKDGQIIVLNPGRTGGAMEFQAVLKKAKVKAEVLIAEAQTFIFASRTIGPAQSRIFGIKNVVPVAALPAFRTNEVVKVISKAFPQFVPAENVLKTSFDNIGAIFHPGPTLLNSGRIESTAGDFEYYHEGITPSVAKVIEQMDYERIAVAEALGIEAISAHEWLDAAYGATGANLYEAIQNNVGYKGISAPASLQHRYIFEDVPASLVPIASIGDMLGVPTQMIKSMINLASGIHGVDYWATGRNVQRLGIAGMTADQIRELVNRGEE
jgi:opine dehydrogenase